MKTCIVPGCSRRAGGKCCGTHAAWLRGRYGVKLTFEQLSNLDPYRRPKGRRVNGDMPPQCQIPGCERPPLQWCRVDERSLALCSMHSNRAYARRDKLFIPGPLIVHSGKPRVYRGYRFLRIDGRRIPEHRWVMQQQLGRRLRSDEHVHHRNGQRLDNRPENLMILSNAEHKLLHFRIGWRIHEFSLEALKQLRVDLDALIAKLETR